VNLLLDGVFEGRFLGELLLDLCQMVFMVNTFLGALSINLGVLCNLGLGLFSLCLGLAQMCTGLDVCGLGRVSWVSLDELPRTELCSLSMLLSSLATFSSDSASASFIAALASWRLFLAEAALISASANFSDAACSASWALPSSTYALWRSS